MTLPIQLRMLLENKKRCFLATCYLDKPHLSLMLFTYLPDDNLIILSSRPDTTKVKNIINNREVALLLYSSGSDKEKPFSCTLYGSAKVLSKEKDNFYRECHYKKHRDMGVFITGENISVITVEIKNAIISDPEDSVQTWSAE
jgi:general stress protein 26